MGLAGGVGPVAAVLVAAELAGVFAEVPAEPLTLISTGAIGAGGPLAAADGGAGGPEEVAGRSSMDLPSECEIMNAYSSKVRQIGE